MYSLGSHSQSIRDKGLWGKERIGREKSEKMSSPSLKLYSHGSGVSWIRLKQMKK